MTAYEIVQTIIGFGIFTVGLVGLCHDIFSNKSKK